MEAKVDPMQPTPAPRRLRGPQKHAPHFDLRGQLYRITAVDLTQIDGVDVQTAQTRDFGSGSGHEPLEGRQAVRLLAQPLPEQPDQRGQGAKAWDTSGSEPSLYRIASGRVELTAELKRTGCQVSAPPLTLGARKAITAMAHLLARLIYRMLKFGHAYVDKGMEHYETKYRHQQLQWVTKQAAALNMQLIPMAGLAH